MVTLLEEMTLCGGGRGPERGQGDAAGVGVSPARAARWQACAAGPQPTRRAASRSPAALSPAVLLAPDASVPSGGAGAPQPLPLALQEAGGRSGAGEWAAGHRSVLSGAEETQALSPRGGSRVPISSYLQQPRKLALFYK